jgi:hypothetical protein
MYSKPKNENMERIDCNFSLNHYQKILKTALDNDYQFVKYDDIENTDGKICVLRHDVDYTPLRALEKAKIEADLGIKAYYFFLINSEIYNIRDRRVYEVVHQLKKIGHHIGLHLDLSWNPKVKWENVVAQCKEEKELFKVLTNIEPCEIISFHNPHIFTEMVLNKSVDGMEHTYEKRYFSDIKYLSDSQGWYEGCVCKIFEQKKYNKIQLLTHPYIWPIEAKHDFTEDMAEMIKAKRVELIDYMVKYHPVCAKNEKRLRALVNS